MDDACSQCDKREFCKVPPDLKPLCQNLEEYLHKTVEVQQKEQPIKKGYDRLCPKEWPATPSTSELVCRMFFSEHRGVVEIARILEVSHQYVSKTVNKYKKILAQNIKK